MPHAILLKNDITISLQKRDKYRTGHKVKYDEKGVS